MMKLFIINKKSIKPEINFLYILYIEYETTSLIKYLNFKYGDKYMHLTFLFTYNSSWLFQLGY